MRMYSMFRGGSLALGLAAAVAFVSPGSVLAQAQQNSTGCYSGAADAAANAACGTTIPNANLTVPTAGQQAAKPGPYSGKESEAAKNTEGCAGTASGATPQDLAKALQASGPGPYGADCAAAAKAEN
jgi:hypothetical protein